VSGPTDAGLRLRGRRIDLRPLAVKEAPIVHRALGRLNRTAGPSRRRSLERLERRFRSSGRFWRGLLDLAIQTRRGRLVGLIQARKRPAQSLPDDVAEIGIVLFESADRGKGYGGEAVELFTDWLFDEGGFERVQAGTGVDNGPMRAVLERMGYRLEGIMRGYAPGEDHREDVVLYAVLRSDWTGGADGTSRRRASGR
jgi:ribosomal-protein-alanine N-acetyltransferase